VIPDHIGRFKVVRLVGSGGMGEVYEGFDDQLQRSVAIKGLLHDRVNPERRERLRREALSAAGLSHPAITHVYEIVEEGDADWVVMEFVKGTSLADLIRTGPLSAGDAAAIGEEIAGALADAHQHGIIHRDIKTENVLLTPSGHVKVLDFGLAKWTALRSADNLPITTDGLVVGTSKAMSPEQALGREVDGRSDIFSLGSLLYELMSGRPAFRGATPLETMHKVAQVDYEPLPAAAPRAGQALAAVIARCMARDPSKRYQDASELAHDLHRVAASATDAGATLPAFGSRKVLLRARKHWATLVAVTAVVTTTAITGLTLGWFAPKKPLTVAVLPVESQALGSAAGLASTAIEDALVNSLARLKDVIVVSGRDVRAVLDSKKRVPEIARELGVRELVDTSLTPGEAGEPNRVDLERLDGHSGRVIWSEQLEVGTDDLLLLQDRISTALGDAYRGFPTTGHPGSQDATPVALKAYLEATSRIDSGKYSKDFKEEIALLETAIAEAPRFLAPVASLAWRYRYLYETYRRPADEDRCLALLKRAEALAPDHPWVLSLEVWIALDRRDNAGAIEKARAWTTSRPGDSVAWRTLAVALDHLERYRESEAAFARSLALLPSWNTFHSVALARELRGDFVGARAAIRQGLAISSGNLFLEGLLAEVEMYAGNNAEAEELYRNLLVRRGTRLDRIHLGNCLYYQRKFSDAASLYREAADMDHTDYLAVANLADTQDAMGQTESAKADYAVALRLCETRYGQGVRRRALLETRARCLAQLRRGPEAFMAIQEALADYPDNPATMFMAALVAAVGGDTNAALAWTEKARLAHAPAIWFTGPEFAHLTQDPRFQALTSER
jgi:eukaryotic-like serine/threonine-protein kinase